MDKVQDAFRKIKRDMLFLHDEIKILKESMSGIIEILKEINPEKTRNNATETSTDQHANKTHATNFTTRERPLRAPDTENLTISTGNQGVTTNRQTDKQTNRHTFISHGKTKNSMEKDLEKLNSLDEIRRGIRLKFKNLTEKEFIIFSAIYQLEEELGHADYKTLSEKVGITESSIRDYVGRLINKGIPVEKNKINNKNVQLKISGNLRKMAGLNEILRLRDM